MSPRTGRPPVDSPKDIGLKVRIDADVNAQLLAYCKHHGITRSEAIRKGIHRLLADEKER